MEYLFTFDNTHHVIAGEKKLLAVEIPVRVMALPAQIGAGCGLCLRVDLDKVDEATTLLQDQKIVFSGLYLVEKQNGKTTYTVVQ